MGRARSFGIHMENHFSLSVMVGGGAGRGGVSVEQEGEPTPSPLCGEGSGAAFESHGWGVGGPVVGCMGDVFLKKNEGGRVKMRWTLGR